MATSTISHKELQQNYEAAEQASHAGPVLITRDGKPRSVLMDIADYRKLTGANAQTNEPASGSLADLLAVPGDEYFDWEPPRLHVRFHPADFDGCIKHGDTILLARREQMASTTIAHAEVEKNFAAAERAAREGPVFITSEYGEPRSVLIDIADYKRLTETRTVGRKTLLDLFDDPLLDGVAQDFEVPKMVLNLSPAHFD